MSIKKNVKITKVCRDQNMYHVLTNKYAIM